MAVYLIDIDEVPDLQIKNLCSNWCHFSPCLSPTLRNPHTFLSVEPAEGEQVCSTDHRLVPVLSQLWDGCFFSSHQQEPSVQDGETDQNLHHTAVSQPGGPS